LSFSDAIRNVLRQYATFRGRASRPEFWWWYLATAMANVAFTALDQVTNGSIAVGFLEAVAAFSLLLPTLAVSVRRLHDSGLSGWWMLAPSGVAVLGAVTFFAGAAAVIAPVFLEGTPDTSGLGVILFAAGSLLLLSSAVVSLVLMVRPSTPGSNRFGPSTVWVRPPGPGPVGGADGLSPYGAG